jgi:hypothetical protein
MIKGISQSFSPEGTPQGYGFYSKNVIINRKLDEIVNEKGTKLIEAFSTAGVTNICGVIPFGRKLIVFYKGTTYVSKEHILQGAFHAGLASWEQVPNGGTIPWSVGTGVLSAALTPANPRTYTLKQTLPDIVVGTPVTVKSTLTRSPNVSTLPLLAVPLTGVWFDVDGNEISTFSLSGSRSNPASNATVGSVVPTGATAIGFRVTRNFLAVAYPSVTASIDNLSLYGPSSATIEGDRIGVYDEVSGTFEEKISRTDFGFDPEYPISGEAKLNSRGELIVAFTDNNVSPKYVNLDTASEDDALDLFNLCFLAKSPNIAATAVEGAGGFKTGCHFVTVQYLDRNKSASNFSPFSNPVYITQGASAEDWREVQGSLGGINTNKGIRIALTDLDPNYSRIRIGVVSKMKDTVTAAVYKEVTYADTELTVLLAGSETVSPSSIEEVITVNQIFDKVKELKALGDQLFGAEITLAEVTDFQEFVNTFTVRWTSRPYYDLFGGGAGNMQLPDGNVKGFMHDEVYALYAQFELPNGRFTDWFHLPGRALTSSHRAVSSNANNVRINGAAPKVYQIEDTCTYDNDAGTISGTSPSSYAYGQMGVWENEDETYPSTFPNYAGEKVRHHRFPSCAFLADNVYHSSLVGHEDYMTKMWDMLGINVEFGTVPSALEGKFTGVRFGFAKRTEASMTVLGYDIVQYAANSGIGNPADDGDNGILTNGGGNFYVQAFGDDNDLKPNVSYVRLHSPDIFVLRPSVSDIYLSNQLRMKVDNLNTLSDGIITSGRVVYNNDEDAEAGIGVFTYVSNYRYSDEINYIPAGKRYSKLSNTKYVPSNVSLGDSDGTINNLLGNEFVHGKIEHDLDIDISGVDSGGYLRTDLGDDVDSPNLYEETVLTQVKALKTNVFVAYKDQIVAALSPIVRDFSVGKKIEGEGDVFACNYSFVSMAPVPNEEDSYTEDANHGIRNIKLFLCESRYNLNQRYTTIGDYNTYFFPFIGNSAIPQDRQQYWTCKLNQLNATVNQIQYSKDFNTINEFEQYGVFDHDTEYDNKLLFALVRSAKASRATSVEDGWRTFKPNDIFYTVRDKGLITNLVAWGTDSLLIHHEQALYKTRDKAVLQTDITLVSLGSGDLFALEPSEVAPTSEGYGGLQNRFGAVLCQAGYVFVDAAVGDLLIYKGGDTYTAINKGFRTFFEETFRTQVIGDNPFKDSGLTLGFDKENYRLVLSLKAESSFTASFDLLKDEWVGCHDYIADFFVNTRQNLYSFKDTSLYVHGQGPYGNFYGTVYPSFVDIIINTEPTKQKILSSVQWLSRVVKNGSVRIDETITHITVWNDTFCTGRIEIAPQTNLWEYDNKNTRQINEGWSFNDLADRVKDHTSPIVDDIFADYRPISDNIDTTTAWFQNPEMRGKYFIVRLEYSNFEDKSVSLRQLLPSLKLSNEI